MRRLLRGVIFHAFTFLLPWPRWRHLTIIAQVGSGIGYPHTALNTQPALTVTGRVRPKLTGSYRSYRDRCRRRQRRQRIVSRQRSRRCPDTSKLIHFRRQPVGEQGRLEIPYPCIEIIFSLLQRSDALPYMGDLCPQPRVDGFELVDVICTPYWVT